MAATKSNSKTSNKRYPCLMFHDSSLLSCPPAWSPSFLHVHAQFFEFIYSSQTCFLCSVSVFAKWKQTKQSKPTLSEKYIISSTQEQVKNKQICLLVSTFGFVSDKFAWQSSSINPMHIYAWQCTMQPNSMHTPTSLVQVLLTWWDHSVHALPMSCIGFACQDAIVHPQHISSSIWQLSPLTCFLFSCLLDLLSCFHSWFDLICFLSYLLAYSEQYNPLDLTKVLSWCVEKQPNRRKIHKQQSNCNLNVHERIACQAGLDFTFNIGRRRRHLQKQQARTKWQTKTNKAAR